MKEKTHTLICHYCGNVTYVPHAKFEDKELRAQLDALVEAAKYALSELYGMNQLFAEQQYENEIVTTPTMQKLEEALKNIK